jgi:hypothetical protein
MERNTVVDKPEDCPMELWIAILEFWPESEHLNAANVARNESGFDAFALNDTATPVGGCGVEIGQRGEVRITSERSVGYFQINACNFPEWEWQRFYNARHNAGTAHALWDQAGGTWSPWFFSARKLGLI